MYQIRILNSAAQELKNIDKSIAQRVAERINWLAANIDNVKLEGLTGELSGLYKLRVGDYRVIYEILHEEKMIMIHAVGHRKDIYRR